jgi:hypothetical protein
MGGVIEGEALDTYQPQRSILKNACAAHSGSIDWYGASFSCGIWLLTGLLH